MSNVDDFEVVDEEYINEIDDEHLISIVQANPCLYAKSDKDFKNTTLKEMKWEVIAKTLNCTSSEAKKRWDTLRNQFCRKRRQQKNIPSGSGTLSEWPLMSCMSFLTPHIKNRRTRSSLLVKTSVTCSETSSSSSILSSTASSTAAYATLSQNITCSDNESTWNDDQSELNCGNIENIPVNYNYTSSQDSNIEKIPVDYNYTSSQDYNIEKIPADYNIRKIVAKKTENILIKPETSKIAPSENNKRKLVPPLDKFAQKKKINNMRLEDLLKTSSQAISDLAVSYKKERVEETEQTSDSNAIVIAQALKTVSPENQISCLIAVLQLIESFKKP